MGRMILGVLIGILSATGCNGDATAWRDLPPYWETVAAEEAKEEALLAKSEPAVRTICGDEIAMEIAPELDELLDVATSYWAQEGFPGIVTGGNYDCDIMVIFADESGDLIKWPHDGAGAAAHLRPGPVKLYIRESRWEYTKKLGVEHIVITHEIGHMHLGKEHAAEGIMATDGGICAYLEAQGGERKCKEEAANEQQ